MSELTIIADENIPALEQYFAGVGKIWTLSGRSINSEDVHSADILLVRSVTRVDRELLQNSSVRFVGSATIGTDHLDVDYLAERGIAWSNAPGTNARSVVEYVVSALCELELVGDLLAGRKQIGIVGMGNVGGRLYQQLDALGIRCVAYDPLMSQDRWPVLTDFDTVLDSDVLCLHTPLTTSGVAPSWHLFDQQRLSRLRPNIVLINAGRGAVIDNTALHRLLLQRNDLGVVLDVWENEPGIDRALMNQVALATPHIAGYSFDGKLAGTRMLAERCRQWLGRDLSSVPKDEKLDGIELKIAGGDTVAAIITQAIKQCYDIRADDQRMREQIGEASNQNAGRVFDGLRKAYPQRREFSHFSLQSDGLGSDAIRYLSALGFTVLNRPE